MNRGSWQKYYLIRIWGVGRVTFNLFDKELGIGPTGRLCEIFNGAMFESEELAKEFISVMEPTFKKRHGDDIELEIIQMECIVNEKTSQRVKSHSEKIQATLERKRRKKGKASAPHS